MMGDADPVARGGETIRFGGYATTKMIGSGGMGTVYEARHGTLGKRVALKVIKGTLAGDPVARERFLREARAIALVSHPHVVDVFDLGIDDGRAFIVMELLEGETLESLLAREKRLAVTHAVDLLLPVISATAAIHDTGVVHRDLKPGNVMLARRGRFPVEPVILDFGISRGAEATSGEEVLTAPHLLVGTLPYLAPEQLRDTRAAGPQSDQYAVGVMLFECVTGRKPFTGVDRYELIHAAMTASIAVPSSLNPEIPRALDDIVLRALARNPEARFPSMRAFGSALLSVADRAAWKRWATEFAGVDHAAPESSWAETADDLSRPPAPHARTASRRAWWLGAAAAFAATTAVALATRARAPAQPAAPSASAPAVAAPAASAPVASSPAVSAARRPTASPVLTADAPIAAAPPPAAVGAPAAAPTREKRRAAAPGARSASAAAEAARSAELEVTSPPPPDPVRIRARSAESAQPDDAIDPFAPVR